MDSDKLTSLIKACHKGNKESQKSLYLEFYAYAMSICIRYVNNRDEAAEILNDAFIKVFDNLNKFNLKKEFKPWLRTIIINTAINYYHKNQKLNFNEHLNEDIKEIAPDDPISQLSYKELIGFVQELPPQYRAVFNLFVIEGYKHEEIAEMLKITVGTSKSNLARAKKNLKNKLDNFFFSKLHVLQME